MEQHVQPSIADFGDEPTEKRLAVKPINSPDSMARPASRLAGWIDALKHILPIYLATHLVFLLLTYLAPLLFLNPYVQQKSPIQTLLQFWDRWDTVHFVQIATTGYAQPLDTAFFPLYPLLIHLLSRVIGTPLGSALLLSNVFGLGMMMVFYRLVAEDFDVERAQRSVLYLALFPTAVFLAAAYSESLFLFCVLCAFYGMRRGHWWLAGLAMFFAALSRSTGVVLAVPFCYEYLRQRDFQWRKIDLNVLACASIGVALASYATYCFVRFHDFLAFSHAETTGWGRRLTWPGEALLRAVFVMMHANALSFMNMRNAVGLSVVLAVLALLVLSFIGPWKFARKDWMYPLYGVVVFLLSISLPVTAPASAPMDSLDRYMLAIFPVAMVLAAIGRNKHFHLFYQALGYSLVAFYTLLLLSHRFLA